ncbi:MAG: adenosylcobinamide-phosphate synthase CbiB [Pseudomonadota bacterium]
MYEATLTILLIALVADWFFGEPEFLWSRFAHPIVLFGKTISFFDTRFNVSDASDDRKYRNGAFSICVLIAIALLAGLTLDWLIEFTGLIGWFVEVFIVFVLLAQKSLHDHVKAVVSGLREEGLDGGQKAVGMIVGRDPKLLDQSGVCRASIESLAENFSDGVVAPAFWYAIFGLPGIIVYKMINTADSMIAYKNEKYLWFGRVAAQIDDLANWLPARMSALLIAIGVGVRNGVDAGRGALKCAMKDNGLHRSPNAGWPEAAMAGGVGIALGGPREYPGETVAQVFLNASGKRDLGGPDIEKCLTVFARACFTLWGVVLVLLLLL